jgi:predicted cupin superfamily sugar epimerase
MPLTEADLSQMDPDVRALVEHYGFERLLVEGTFYASTWAAQRRVEEGGPAGTAMIGLYTARPQSVSLFHRLAYDEVWHFYSGDPLRLFLLHPDGGSQEVVLGADWQHGQLVQFVIPAGVWQAGELLPGGRWALYGCTMAPGFTPDIFEAGRLADLLPRYPERAEDIHRLCVAEA